jgi:hypothetical protein
MKNRKKKATSKPGSKLRDLKSKKDPRGGSIMSLSPKLLTGWLSPKLQSGWISQSSSLGST